MKKLLYLLVLLGTISLSGTLLQADGGEEDVAGEMDVEGDGGEEEVD